MKKSTELILRVYPRFYNLLPTKENQELRDNVLKEIDYTEQALLKLVWFFEKPETQSFCIKTLYNDLKEGDLELALEAIHTFFYVDTYLISQPTHSLITSNNNEEFLTPTQCAEVIGETIPNFNYKNLNTNLRRGKFPTPDLELGGRDYWKKQTCEEYALSKEQQNKDKRNE